MFPIYVASGNPECRNVELYRTCTRTTPRWRSDRDGIRSTSVVREDGSLASSFRNQSLIHFKTRNARYSRYNFGTVPSRIKSFRRLSTYSRLSDGVIPRSLCRFSWRDAHLFPRGYEDRETVSIASDVEGANSPRS
jgi:hypothetical protein